MIFDLQNPHTVYVIAAYAVAAMGYGALVLHTFFKWRAQKNMAKKMEQQR